jgi:delta8-fatty-acid desaturase
MGRGSGSGGEAATELRELLGRAVEVPVDSHIRGTVAAKATHSAAKAKAPAADSTNGAAAASSPSPPHNAPLPRVTMAAVAAHDKRGDLWIVVRGIAYDLSGWEAKHPGGILPLLNLAGRDATDPFEAYHPANAWGWLKRFEVAVVTDALAAPGSAVHEMGDGGGGGAAAAAAAQTAETVAPRKVTMERGGGTTNASDSFGKAGSYAVTVAFRALRQRLLAEGFYETQRSYYYGLTLWFATLFGAMLYAVFALRSAPLGALFLGGFFQQMAFLGHDLGHNAVTHCRRTDGLLGHVFGNLLTGISVAWWKRSHNVHHVVTNSIDCDPDIQHLPVMTVVADILSKTGDPDHDNGAFFSTYHEKEFDVNHPLIRLVIGVQHWLYYPIMALARWNLYAQSWILLLTRPAEVEGWWKEFAGNAGFVVWLAALTCYGFPAGTGERATFLLLSHAIAGLTLHVQITMSHFSAATFMGRPYGANDDADGWVHTQLAGSIDIDCPPWLDWFHGGLQFQVRCARSPRPAEAEPRPATGTFSVFYFCLLLTATRFRSRSSTRLPALPAPPTTHRRSSTTYSRACRATTCAGFRAWCAPSARSTG